MREIIIDNDCMDMRLDRFVLRVTTLSKGEVQKVIRKKVVKVNGKRQEANYRLMKGDSVKFFLPDEKYKNKVKTTKKALVASLNIVYEDDNIVIINKPTGLLSQGSGDDEKNIVDSLKSYAGSQDVGVVTRLDRNTSGIVLAGKSRRGLMVLNELNRVRELDKRYMVLVHGVFNEEGTVTHYGKKSTADNRLLLFDSKGDDRIPVTSKYKVMKRYDEFTLLEVKLVTGRSHQIRSQLAHMGYPVVGDVKYGKKDKGIGRQFLHCYKIGIRASEKYKDIIPNDIHVKIELSEDLKTYLKRIRMGAE